MSFRDKVFQKYLQDIEDDLNYEADNSSNINSDYSSDDSYITTHEIFYDKEKLSFNNSISNIDSPSELYSNSYSNSNRSSFKIPIK